MLQIGELTLQGHFGLAPMAGVTDRAFRRVCAEAGAGYAVSEMVSAKALTYRDKKSAHLLDISGCPCPCGIQLFGSEPDVIAEGVRLAYEICHPPVIDLNMGCPVPKVTGNGEGSALLKNPPLAEAVASAAVRASPVPVTVKFRTGWDEAHINCEEIAKRLEQAGVSALCIHGRTRAQGYSGLAIRELMARTVAAVSVPVMVNGDISSPEDGASLLRDTGAKYALIGRGALGNPWIFARCEAYANGAPVPVAPSPEEKLSTLIYQTRLSAEQKGESVAVREARKHAAWYLKGFRGAAVLRTECNRLSTLSELCAWVERALLSLSE